MNIAIIPARGGSKRIPGKNVMSFCGVPIIGYSIRAALESGSFDRVIVSTDNAHIADVAKDHGAEVPFMRPAELSDDHTPTIPVVRHAIEALESNGADIELACCIYATAPFIHVSDIQQSLALLIQNDDAEFSFPITTFAFPILRSVRLDNGFVFPVYPEHEMTRSQDLPEAYHDAGQFYWGRAEAWKQRERLYSGTAVGLRIPRHRVQDIDTPDDWVRAEKMFKAETITPEQQARQKGS